MQQIVEVPTLENIETISTEFGSSIASIGASIHEINDDAAPAGDSPKLDAGPSHVLVGVESRNAQLRPGAKSIGCAATAMPVRK